MQSEKRQVEKSITFRRARERERERERFELANVEVAVAECFVGHCDYPCLHSFHFLTVSFLSLYPSHSLKCKIEKGREVKREREREREERIKLNIHSHVFPPVKIRV